MVTPRAVSRTAESNYWSPAKRSGAPPIQLQEVCVSTNPAHTGQGGAPSGRLHRLLNKMDANMLATLLIGILVLALLGAFPRWWQSMDWGYAPTSGVGTGLFVGVLVVLGRI